MTGVLEFIGSVAGVVTLVLIVVFRRGIEKYVDEKAKNLATIEDTARITQEVEAVKSLHLRQSHAWKWVFEKEYDILQRVWNSTWDFQATARSLRPIMDQLPLDEEEKEKVFTERYKYYGEAVGTFRDAVLRNKPFIPPVVYEQCLELRTLVIQLEVDFEMSFRGEGRPDWKMIVDCGKQLDNKLEELNAAIRKYVHAKINDVRQDIGLDALTNVP